MVINHHWTPCSTTGSWSYMMPTPKNIKGTVRPLFREGTVSPLRPLGQAERSVSPCNSPLRLHRVGKITGEPPKRCMLGAVGPSSSFSSSWEVASLFQHAASPWRRVGWRTDKHAEGRAGLTAWWLLGSLFTATGAPFIKTISWDTRGIIPVKLSINTGTGSVCCGAWPADRRCCNAIQ
mgnify:CR=1 FL=1